jgi:dipeptidyl aminopeptidase/acylaminoacyl peptidase
MPSGLSKIAAPPRANLSTRPASASLRPGPTGRRPGTPSLLRDLVAFQGHAMSASRVLSSLAVLLACWAAGHAADPVPLGKEEYLLPPKVIADAVLAAQPYRPLADLSPDGTRFVVPRGDSLPPLSRLAGPTVRLAELAFDPAAGRSLDLWTRSYDGFDLFSHADRKTVPVKVPANVRVSNPVWSPDGSKLAFFAHTEDATHIHVADAETGESKPLTTAPVLATLATSFQWSRDGKTIQTVLRPGGSQFAPPKPAAVAAEPKVRVARDGKDPSRTYRYLLDSPHDMKLLEHLVTGQLAVVNVADGSVTAVGNPRMIRSVAAAPDGKHVRVSTVKKPFSYYFPFPRFGTLDEVWGTDGKSFVVLADKNLQEKLPDSPPAVAAATPGRTRPTTPTTPTPDPDPPTPDPNPDPTADQDRRPGPPTDPDAKRDIAWRPDGAGLAYLHLEPKGKDEKAVRKDRVMLWVPPFGKDDAKAVYTTPDRISSAQYDVAGKWLFLTQTIDNRRQITAVDLADPKVTHVVYKSGPPPKSAAPDPKDAAGNNEQVPAFAPRSSAGLLTQGGVVRVSKAGDVYLSGTERPAGKDAPYPRPHLDKVAIVGGKKTRLYEGKGDTFESIDAVDGDDPTCAFVTRQKADVPPNSFKVPLDSGEATKLTDNVDRAPWARKLKVERIRVTRADGFKFWAKVTTPPDAKGKLPALFWIYPREYADQAAYDASAGRTASATSGRFVAPTPRSMTLFTLLGYAVVEPDVPIVGPAGRMNDNYVPDLRNSLWAVIDELDKRGVIDRDRLAVGGHSYGAFSTANALAHTPFFKAGIAGDGNYNRTLTAMSFQSERRSLWDARETYLEMSPLLYADRIHGALLMYHGMEDANVGTDPINAEMLFLALDGLGKPAALYMYPYEGHGPLARETTLDLWARWAGWLDKYVKK